MSDQSIETYDEKLDLILELLLELKGKINKIEKTSKQVCVNCNGEGSIYRYGRYIDCEACFGKGF